MGTTHVCSVVKAAASGRLREAVRAEHLPSLMDSSQWFNNTVFEAFPRGCSAEVTVRRCKAPVFFPDKDLV